MCVSPPFLARGTAAVLNQGSSLKQQPWLIFLPPTQKQILTLTPSHSQAKTHTPHFWVLRTSPFLLTPLPWSHLQKINQPCLQIEPRSLGCPLALHSNAKAMTPAESLGAWPGGHHHPSRLGSCYMTSQSSRSCPQWTPTSWIVGLLHAGSFHMYLGSSVPGTSLETLCPIHTWRSTLTLLHGGENIMVRVCVLRAFL